MISLTSPIKTRAHKWPAGWKILGLCAGTLGLFSLQSVTLQLVVLCSVLALYALPGVDFLKAGLGHLRMLWPFIIIAVIWHVWISDPTTGAKIILRLISAVALANLVTMTTRLSDMIDVFRFVALPLKQLGLRSNVLELAIALVIRMVPTLVQKGQTLVTAWRARSPKRASWQIVLPFTVLALDDADHVAEALMARGGLNPMEEN